MTIQRRITQIKTVLRQYSRLFVDLENDLRSMKIAGNILIFPKTITYRQPEGARLRHNIGYLYLSETYSPETDTVDSYIYRFCSDEYTYIAASKQDNDMADDMFFNFHYQNDQRHEPHVSFLHNNLRYISESIKLGQFLDFVDKTFFMADGSRLDYKPWDSRIPARI